MRADTFGKVPFGMLSRGISGLRGATVIVNLPGSPKAVEESLAVIGSVLHHAVALAGIAETGPALPLMGDLGDTLLDEIHPAADGLLAWNRA